MLTVNIDYDLSVIYHYHSLSAPFSHYPICKVFSSINRFFLDNLPTVECLLHVNTLMIQKSGHFSNINEVSTFTLMVFHSAAIWLGPCYHLNIYAPLFFRCMIYSDRNASGLLRSGIWIFRTYISVCPGLLCFYLSSLACSFLNAADLLSGTLQRKY